MGRHPYMHRFSYPSGKDLKIVDGIMEVIRIHKSKAKHITELSGGEKQRLSFQGPWPRRHVC